MNNYIPKHTNFYQIFLIFGLLLGFLSYAQAEVTITLEGLEEFYIYQANIDKVIEANLVETVPPTRSQPIDLWASIKAPSGEVFFLTVSPQTSFSLEPQPFKTSVPSTETTHKLLLALDEFPETIGGEYTFSVLYAQVGTNPVTEGDTVHRSNLVTQTTTIVNAPPKKPEPEISIPAPGSTLNFRDSAVGSSVTQEIVISNNGDTDLVVDFISITAVEETGVRRGTRKGSQNFGGFSILTQFPLSIAPGNSQTVTMQYLPSSVELVIASLQLSINNPTQPILTYFLKGIGTSLVDAITDSGCSSADCKLARRFAPVLKLSSAGAAGGVNIKTNDYPYTDYIPININDVTSNPEKLPIFRKKTEPRLSFELLNYPDTAPIKSDIEIIGKPELRDKANYLDFSPIWWISIQDEFGSSHEIKEIPPEISYRALTLNPTVYFRVFHNPQQENPIAIQYWFFYAYNDWAKFTDHPGDWESITIFLDKNEKPVEAVYSTHYEANRHSWNDVLKDGSSSHPFVYISNGGHGSYKDGDNTSYHWIGFIDNHKGNREILKIGSKSSLQEGLYVIEDLREKDWLKFQGGWGREKKPLQGPLFRTDASTTTDWVMSKNPPRDPYSNCIPRLKTLIYGSLDPETSKSGPWCWASGYVIDRNMKIDGGEQCRPIVPISAEIGCKDENPLKVDMELHYDDSGMNFSSRMVKAEDYDGTPIYLTLSGSGYGKTVNFDFEIDGKESIEGPILATLSGYYNENRAGLIRLDSFEGNFDGQNKLFATDINRQGEGCDLYINLKIRRSPCQVNYIPPSEKPAFPSQGYIGKARFTDNGNGTVTDNETGLIWLQNANCDSFSNFNGKRTLSDSLIETATLRANRGGKPGRCNLKGDANQLGDWRIPDMTELRDFLAYVRANHDRLVTLEGMFNKVRWWKYWSVTTKGNDSDNAWLFNMEDGTESYESKYTKYHVWPVHARFTDNANGTVTDNQTGLIWLKDANCYEDQNWHDATSMTDNLKAGECNLTDGSKPGDWYIPQLNEFHQLLHGVYEQSDTPDMFNNAQREERNYWTNSTEPGSELGSGNNEGAWNVFIDSTSIQEDYHDKGDPRPHYVWPVRSRRASECVGTAFLRFYDHELPVPCEDTDWEPIVDKQIVKFR